SRDTDVLNSSNAATIMRPARREETTALWLFITGIALRDKSILPVRNGLPCVGPNGTIKQAPRQIIDRYLHFASGQDFHRLSKLFLVIQRVHPKKMIIGDCKSSILKTHQRDVIYKRQIAGKPFARGQEPWGSDSVQHHSNFDVLSSVFQLENSKYRFIECT